MLSNPEFAELIAAAAEEGRPFENADIVSNETDDAAIATLKRSIHKIPSGAYIGVGPDQNYAYIAAVNPTCAFIVDVRRDNLIEHLMFKVLFEVSTSRREYLARLFGKAIRDPLQEDEMMPFESIVMELDRTERSEEIVHETLQLLPERIKAYGLEFSEADRVTIQRIYQRFVDENLNLRFRVTSERYRNTLFPSYRAVLLNITDRESGGHFLRRSDDFAAIKAMHASNRIIPIVGDVCGDRALRAIATFLGRRGAIVSVVYLSNVEMYLAGSEQRMNLLRNLKVLPTAATSLVVRLSPPAGDTAIDEAGHLLVARIDSLTDLLSAARSDDPCRAEGVGQTAHGPAVGE